jgi:hypothetical protein
MDERLDHEIRSQLSRYLRGAASLAEFQEWFVPVFWTIQDRNDPQAEALANQIQGILSEASTSRWPEVELQSHLLPLAQERPVPTA